MQQLLMMRKSFSEVLEAVFSAVGVSGRLCIVAHSIASTLVLPLINKVSNIIMVEGNLLESHLIIAKKLPPILMKSFNCMYTSFEPLVA